MKGKIASTLALLVLAGCKPTAESQQVILTKNEITAITLEAKDRDNDPLIWSVSQPSNGTITGTPPNVTYEPNHGYYGPDSFTFHVNDGSDDSNVATVSLVVNNLFPNWTMDQGNANHDGYVPVSLNHKIFSVAWEKSFSNGLYHQVSSGNGRVFVTSYRKLEALLISSGATSWEHQYFEGEINTNPATYADGRVYFQAAKDGNTSSALRGYDALTGEWGVNFPFGSQWQSYLAPTYFDGELYFSGGAYGGGYAINSEQGYYKWFTTLPQEDVWSPAVDETRFIAFTGEQLHILNRETGGIIASINDPEALAQFRGIGNSVILDGANNRAFARQMTRVAAYDLNTRQLAWSVNDAYDGQMAFNGAFLYANNGSNLDVIDAATGEIVNSWHANAKLIYNVVVTDNLIFTASKNETFALDIETLEVLWSTSTGGRLSLSGEGGLFIASENKKLTLIDVEGDADGDSLPTWYERFARTNPWVSDSLTDRDEDGLSELEEFNAGTNPLLQDTDGDTLTDKQELSEVPTNPSLADTDNDNIPDNIEIDADLDPLLPGDAYQDADNDGYWNVTELLGDGDINRIEVLPTVFTGTINFEGQTFPAGVSVLGSEKSWQFVTSDAPSGTPSMSISDGAILVLEGLFDYGEVTISVRNSCGNAQIYIDGWQQRWRSGLGWTQMTFPTKQGKHRIEIHSNPCDGSIEVNEFTFEKNEPFDLSNALLYSVRDDYLNIIDHNGSVINSIHVPDSTPDCCGSIRDVVALGNDKIAIVNGTFSGALTLFSPSTGFVDHKLYNWHNINNLSYGGIDAYNQFIYMSITGVSGAPFSGFVRVDSNTFETVYVEGQDFIDLTIGLDGVLYTLGEYGNILKYDPITLEYLGSVNIIDTRAIAVDTESNIYSATWYGRVQKYNSLGNYIQEVSAGGSNFDINIDPYSGWLAISDRNESITVISNELIVQGIFPNTGNFVTWTPYSNVQALPVQDQTEPAGFSIKNAGLNKGEADQLGFIGNSGE